MQVYFDDKDVLHVCAEDATEVMALKYWKNEYVEHGSKMLELDLIPKDKHPVPY